MTQSTIAHELAKATPPVSVALATLFGMSLQDWVLVATLVYIVLQAGFLIYRWYRMFRGE
jgi:disulfide bond formation protein DsbB